MKDTILIVDDEKEIADLLELYISAEGYTVEKAYTAAEALDFYAAKDGVLIRGKKKSTAWWYAKREGCAFEEI